MKLEPKLVAAVQRLGFRLVNVAWVTKADEAKGAEGLMRWELEDLETGEHRTVVSYPRHLADTLKEGIDKFDDYNARRPETLELYRLINQVLAELPDQQYTTRQIFYRLVALGVNDPCPNRLKEKKDKLTGEVIVKGWKKGDRRPDPVPFVNSQTRYNKLTVEVSQARERGYVSWRRIIDRGRQVVLSTSWESPEEILNQVCSSYRLDRQKDQPKRLELWAEKKTLQGILEPLGLEYGIPTLISQGEFSSTCCYESVTKRLLLDPRPTLILYVGDYDPTGLMSIEENISKQLHLYSRKKLEFEVRRVAITKAQAQKFHLPPAMAKTEDLRTAKFVEAHGDETWEVEALPPGMLERLVDEAIRKALDFEVYQEILDREKEDVARLTAMIKRTRR